MSGSTNTPANAIGQANTQKSTNLEYALLLAEWGFEVFPLNYPKFTPNGIVCSCGKADCPSVGKHPLWIKDLFTEGHNSATRDRAKITVGWSGQKRSAYRRDANIGIGKMYITPNGESRRIIAIDIDGSTDPLKDGEVTIAGLEQAHGPLPKTLEAKSGRIVEGRAIGGRHLIYLIPLKWEGTFKRTLGPGVDIKCAGVGYVAAPPSLHKSGQRYEWLVLQQPAEAPEWLMEACARTVGPEEDKGGTPARPTGDPFEAGSLLSDAVHGLWWAESSGGELEMIEAALRAVDKDYDPARNDRAFLSRDLFQEITWSLRALQDWFARDLRVSELAFAHAHQFAEHHEGKYFSTLWNYRRPGGRMYGKGHLLAMADAATPGHGGAPGAWRAALSAEGRGAAARVLDLGGWVANPYTGALPGELPAVGTAGEGERGRPAGFRPVADVTPVSRQQHADSPHRPGVQQRPLAEMPISMLTPNFVRYPVLNEDEGPKVTTMLNSGALLNTMGLTPRYDTFLGAAMIQFSDGSRRKADDRVLSELHGIAHACGLTCSKNLIGDTIVSLAEQRPCDSGREFLDGAPAWDGESRVETLFIRYFGCPDTPYYRELAKLMGVAMIRRILQPGCKYDFMPVLGGPEGIGKSTFFRFIVGQMRFEESLTFADDSKTIIEKMEGKLAAEIAELSNMRTKEIEHVKSMITRTQDTARAAYGRFATTKPRTFCLFGTTNDDKPLASRTGNRRFMMVKCQKKADLTALLAEVPQLWAEWRVLEAAWGERLELPSECWAEAKQLQDDSVSLSEIEETVRDAVSDFETGKIKIADIYRLIGVTTSEQASRSQVLGDRIRAVMKASGWFEARGAIDGKTTRFFQKKGKKGPLIVTVTDSNGVSYLKIPDKS